MADSPEMKALAKIAEALRSADTRGALRTWKRLEATSFLAPAIARSMQELDESPSPESLLRAESAVKKRLSAERSNQIFVDFEEVKSGSIDPSDREFFDRGGLELGDISSVDEDDDVFDFSDFIETDNYKAIAGDEAQVAVFEEAQGDGHGSTSTAGGSGANEAPPEGIRGFGLLEEEGSGFDLFDDVQEKPGEAGWEGEGFGDEDEEAFREQGEFDPFEGAFEDNPFSDEELFDDLIDVLADDREAFEPRSPASAFESIHEGSLDFSSVLEEIDAQADEDIFDFGVDDLSEGGAAQLPDEMSTVDGDLDWSRVEQAGGAFDEEKTPASGRWMPRATRRAKEESAEEDEGFAGGEGRYRGEPLFRGESDGGANPPRNPFAHEAPTGVREPLRSFVQPDETQFMGGQTSVPAGILLEGGLQLMARGDYVAARDVVRSVLAIHPDSAAAQELKSAVEEKLQARHLQALGGEERIPKVALTLKELAGLQLDHRAGFLLSQIDGMSTVQDIADVSAMGRLETFELLVDLFKRKVITLH